MILVTGGTGFVGAYLLMELSATESIVRAIKRPDSSVSYCESIFNYFGKSRCFSKIEWITADILDTESLRDAMKGVKTVYHCAATVSFSRDQKEELFLCNITGTCNVVNAALSEGVIKLCHVSSIAALGDGEMITEETVFDEKKKHSAYAWSKYKSELEAWRGGAEGLDVVIVCPSVITGPWKKNSGAGALFNKIKKGLSFYATGSTAFVDVRDVVKIMIGLTSSNHKDNKYILSSENISFKDFSNIIASLLNVKAPRIKAGKFFIEIYWRINALLSVLLKKKPDLVRENARMMYKCTSYSNKKITETLGFQFISVEESLRDMNTYFQSK